MDTLIAGAGLSGLSCSLALGRNVCIIEKESRPGGLCRSETVDGFTLDRTGHYLHFRNEDVRRFVLRLLNLNTARFSRRAWIYFDGIYSRYPFQANTFGRDRNLVRECVLGFLKASRGAQGRRESLNYLDWIRRTFGPGIARHFLIPYNRKMFRTPLSRLSPEQGGRFVPRPSDRDVIEGALFPKGKELGYNPVFYHPRSGGIEALVKALRGLSRGWIAPAHPLTGVDWKRRRARIGDYHGIQYDTLVSTIPLPRLLGMMQGLPASIRRASDELRWVGVVNVNFLLRKPVERGRHWVYFSENKYPFYRLGFPGNIVRTDAPKGGGIISAEISYLPSAARPLRAAEKETESALVRMGLIRSKRDILKVVTFDIPFAYVLFDKKTKERRDALMRFLASNGVMSIGRYGGWRYSSMEEAISEGLRAGGLIRAHARRAPALAIKEMRA